MSLSKRGSSPSTPMPYSKKERERKLKEGIKVIYYRYHSISITMKYEYTICGTFASITYLLSQWGQYSSDSS